MKSERSFSIIAIRGIVILGDFITLNLCLFITFLCKERLQGMEINWQEEERVLLVLVNMAYAISLSCFGIILDKRAVFIEKILSKIMKTVIFHLFILFAALFIMNSFVFPVSFWVLYSVFLLVMESCWRILARLTLKYYRSKGGNHRRIIILGAGSVADEVYKSFVSNISYGYKFMGFFDDRNPIDYKVDKNLVIGNIDAVPIYAEENRIDEIICALPAGDDRKVISIIKFAENNLIRCSIVPDFKRFIKKKVALSFLEEIPIISLRNEPLQNMYNQFIKRCFDICFSSVFLLTVFPILYFVLGIAIKLSSPGPVFFKQKRTGKNGKDFYCIKFRTMKVNQGADLLQATKGDNRITRPGSFMRKTNLDEMPQFINVFIGNMSIVGPRPHMLKHTEMYSQLIDKYMVRHFAKPGITGWAQVKGFRGETKDITEMEGRIKKDVWYIENWTFLLDIKIVFFTVCNMLKGEDKAY